MARPGLLLLAPVLPVVLCVLLFGAETLACNAGTPYKSDVAQLALTESGEGVSFGTDAAPYYHVEKLVGIETVATTAYASTVLLNTSDILVWGKYASGGDPGESVPLTGVGSITSTPHAFAALYLNGSVRAWGHPLYGGSSSLCVCEGSHDEYTCVDDTCLGAPLEGVKEVFANGKSFAVIMNGTLSIKTWGQKKNGGDSSSVSGALDAGGFITVFSSGHAFCAERRSSGTASLGFWG